MHHDYFVKVLLIIITGSRYFASLCSSYRIRRWAHFQHSVLHTRGLRRQASCLSEALLLAFCCYIFRFRHSISILYLRKTCVFLASYMSLAFLKNRIKLFKRWPILSLHDMKWKSAHLHGSEMNIIGIRPIWTVHGLSHSCSVTFLALLIIAMLVLDYLSEALLLSRWRSVDIFCFRHSISILFEEDV